MLGTLCILLTVIHTGSGYVWRTGLNIFCISDTLIWPRTCSASRVTRRGLSTVLRDCCAGLWRVTMFICSPSPLQTVWRRWRVRSASCWVPGEESDARLSSLWYDCQSSPGWDPQLLDDARSDPVLDWWHWHCQSSQRQIRLQDRPHAQPWWCHHRQAMINKQFINYFFF